jgi:hypothetical protein
MNQHTTFFERVSELYLNYKKDSSRYSNEFAALFASNSIDISQLDQIRTEFLRTIAPLELSSGALAAYMSTDVSALDILQKKTRRAAQTKLNTKFNTIIADALELV